MIEQYVETLQFCTQIFFKYDFKGNEIRKNYFENNNNVDKLVEMLRVNHMLNFF